MHYKPSFRIVYIFFAKILLNFYGIIFGRQGIADEFCEEFGQGKSHTLVLFQKKRPFRTIETVLFVGVV
jgi:hypothetical protein